MYRHALEDIWRGAFTLMTSASDDDDDDDGDDD